MALHNIKIVVVDGGKAGSSRAKNAGADDTNKNSENGKNSLLYKSLNLKQTIKNKAIKNGNLTSSGVLMLNMTSGLAKQVVSQTANYYISDIGRKNGDSNYQQQINHQIEIVTDVTGTISSTLSSAATGSMFGPVGAVVGAVSGFASSVISIGFRQAERERSYQWELFEQNTSQSYNLARANYSATTGRLR